MLHYATLGRTLCLIKMKHGTDALTNRGSLGALEIDLPVETHEQLHGLQLRIPGGHIATMVHKFVGEILDRVAQNLEGLSGLRSDLATAIATKTSNGGHRLGLRSGEVGVH